MGLTNVTRAGFGSESSSSSSPLSRRAIQGPHMDRDFPDPSLIFGDGSWKAYGTSSSGKTIPIAESGDAQTWTFTDTDALPDPGAWVDPNDRGIWAPDVNKNDDGVYVMYYTGKKAGGSHCVGVATSSTTTGPFTPSDEPLVCDDAGGGIIDPAGYDDGTNRWLMWKVDGNSLGGATTCTGGPKSGDYMPTPIKLQRMSRDGLTLLDSAKTILDNEGASNDGVVEAPTLYKVRDDLFVSCPPPLTRLDLSSFVSRHVRWRSRADSFSYRFCSTVRTATQATTTTSSTRGRAPLTAPTATGASCSAPSTTAASTAPATWTLTRTGRTSSFTAAPSPIRAAPPGTCTAPSLPSTGRPSVSK